MGKNLPLNGSEGFKPLDRRLERGLKPSRWIFSPTEPLQRKLITDMSAVSCRARVVGDCIFQAPLCTLSANTADIAWDLLHQTPEGQVEQHIFRRLLVSSDCQQYIMVADALKSMLVIYIFIRDCILLLVFEGLDSSGVAEVESVHIAVSWTYSQSPAGQY